MSDQKKIIITAFLVVACLGFGGFVYMSFSQSKASPSAQAFFAEVNGLYEAHNYLAAHEKIKGKEQELLNAPEGCELMISVYAESSLEPSFLEHVSRLCIEQKKAPGIAHEGLAKSLLEQKKASEAIDLILKETVVHPNNDRVFAVLSHLYLMNSQPKESTDALMKAIAVSPIWSAWLSRFMRIKELSGVKEHLKAVGSLVLQKDPIPQEGVVKLIQALEEQGEKDLADQIRNHHK